jgi:hypothetical protein
MLVIDECPHVQWSLQNDILEKDISKKTWSEDAKFI